MTNKEKWEVLNAGGKITNGEYVVWYEDMLLQSDPEGMPMDVFNEDDGWYELHELRDPEVEEPHYCLWYREMPNGDIKVEANTWHPAYIEPPAPFKKLSPSMIRRADLLGSSD